MDANQSTMNVNQNTTNTSLKHLIITHKGCPDGRAAAYIYNKKYPSMVVPADADQLTVDFFKSLRYENVTKIVILDLTVNSGWEFLGQLNLPILHIDHHIAKESKETKPLIEQIHDVNKSAAVLVWEYCFPQKEIPLIYQYIQDRDLFLNKMPNADFILSALHHRNFLNNLENLEANFPTEELILEGKFIVPERQRKINNMVKFGKQTKLDFKGNTYSVLLVKGDSSLKSDACNAAAANYDIGVYYEYDFATDEFWLSFRSQRINVQEICSNIITSGKKGGGHMYASGCSIGNDTVFCGKKIRSMHDIFKFVDGVSGAVTPSL